MVTTARKPRNKYKTMKHTITVKRAKELVDNVPVGQTITYISGKNKHYSWGERGENIKDIMEELNQMGDRQHVQVTLENTEDLERKEREWYEKSEIERRQQYQMSKIFNPTRKKIQVVENSLSKNTYTTWIDEVNGITRTDWNNVTGKYTKLT